MLSGAGYGPFISKIQCTQQPISKHSQVCIKATKSRCYLKRLIKTTELMGKNSKGAEQSRTFPDISEKHRIIKSSGTTWCLWNGEKRHECGILSQARPLGGYGSGCQRAYTLWAVTKHREISQLKLRDLYTWCVLLTLAGNWGHWWRLGCAFAFHVCLRHSSQPDKLLCLT